MSKTQAKQLVVCIENDGYVVSLEKRKIYVALRDTAAESTTCSVVDELGEDYLYPKAFFRAIALPSSGQEGRVGSVTGAANRLRPRRRLVGADGRLCGPELRSAAEMPLLPQGPLCVKLGHDALEGCCPPNLKKSPHFLVISPLWG